MNRRNRAAAVDLHDQRRRQSNMAQKGGFLDDRQVADLLTYLRSSWGNDVAPVSPEEVAAVRQATQNRDRMWTEAELTRD